MKAVKGRQFNPDPPPLPAGFRTVPDCPKDALDPDNWLWSAMSGKWTKQRGSGPDDLAPELRVYTLYDSARRRLQWRHWRVVAYTDGLIDKDGEIIQPRRAEVADPVSRDPEVVTIAPTLPQKDAIVNMQFWVVDNEDRVISKVESRAKGEAEAERLGIQFPGCDFDLVQHLDTYCLPFPRGNWASKTESQLPLFGR